MADDLCPVCPVPDVPAGRFGLLSRLRWRHQDRIGIESGSRRPSPSIDEFERRSLVPAPGRLRSRNKKGLPGVSGSPCPHEPESQCLLYISITSLRSCSRLDSRV
jgi:hypothetical protein